RGAAQHRRHHDGSEGTALMLQDRAAAATREPGDAAPALFRRVTHALRRHPGLVRLGVIALLFVLWEIAAGGWVDPMFLSPPSRVFGSIRAVFDTRGVPAALWITLQELAIAFVLSVAIGLVVGLAVGLSSFSRASVMPIILLLYGTPQITI